MAFDDVGPISKHASSFARVWYSILGVGSEKECRYLMGTGIKNEQSDRSWDLLMDSFEQLSRPIEKGSWGGVLLFFGADLDYVCSVLKLPTTMAPKCACSAKQIRRTFLMKISMQQQNGGAPLWTTTDSFFEYEHFILSSPTLCSTATPTDTTCYT